MKSIASKLSIVSVLASSSLALACPHNNMNNNTVTLPLSAQTWVKSQTAKVIVELNASLKQKQVLDLPKKLHKNLHKLADQNWHITHFNKESAKSGLDKVTIQAQTRLDNQAILKLKKQLKDVSEAGMTYHLKKVDYKPSFKQLQHNRAQLRQSIYKQAQQESNSLQKTYNNRHPHIQSINFIPGLLKHDGGHPNPRQLNMVRLAGASNGNHSQTQSAAFPISQKLKQKAIVKIQLNS